MTKYYDIETHVWTCPECGASIENWDYKTLTECGSPVCQKCDEDMELEE